MENDGFTLVKSKKSKTNKTNKQNSSTYNHDYDLNENLNEERCDKLKQTILDYKNKLLNQDENKYWLKFKTNLLDFLNLKNENEINRELIIKSYGLGSLDHNLNSRYQFALLLLIIDELNNYFSIKNLDIYDPIFNLNDKYLIKNLFNFNLIKKNDEGKCSIDLNQVTTLFYMPHCGKPLYNNLLYSNWCVEKLNNLYLIGNSFELINTITLNDDLVKYYKLIKSSMKFIHEININSKCDFTDAFSDTSLHKFKPSSESDLSLGKDVKLEEPVYERDDEIVFSK